MTPPSIGASAAAPAAEAPRHGRREAGVLANFYPELTLRDGGRMVDAAGPLNWDEIPAGVELISVIAVVAQNGVEGRSASREYRRADGEREWWCEVRAEDGRAFEPGPAPCAGALYIADPNGALPWPWVSDPELVGP
jgi:hypothetical protein